MRSLKPLTLAVGPALALSACAPAAPPPVFIGHVPELDLSSCGETVESARENIREAVAGFLRTAERIGTLNEILEEAGFRFDGDHWTAPEFVSIDRLSVELPA